MHEMGNILERCRKGSTESKLVQAWELRYGFSEEVPYELEPEGGRWLIGSRRVPGAKKSLLSGKEERQHGVIHHILAGKNLANEVKNMGVWT